MTSDEIYRTQQFGQRTGFGKRPALLVVDFVNGFADPQLLGGGNIRDAIAATAPLLAFFRERKLPVIFTRIVYAEDGSDAGLWCEKAPRLRLLTESADASQVVSELAPRAGEFVVPQDSGVGLFRNASRERPDRQSHRYAGCHRVYDQRLRPRECR